MMFLFLIPDIHGYVIVLCKPQSLQCSVWINYGKKNQNTYNIQKNQALVMEYNV